MRAVTLSGFGEAPVLSDVPTPTVSPGQVRVRVVAAALNRLDTAIVAGMMRAYSEYRFPVVLGRDGAGVVDEVGEGVEDIAVGDQVVCHVTLGAVLHEGTLAEYVAVPAQTVVPRPHDVDAVVAAAVPLAGAAALLSVRAIDPKPGHTVLIIGASGGVGLFAVQMAAARGASVIATCLPEDAQRLRRLGAAEMPDYRDDVIAVLRDAYPDGLDGLIELVSFDQQGVTAAAALLRPGGRLASTLAAADVDALATAGITATNVAAYPDRAMLTELLDDVAEGRMRVDVEQVLTFDQAPKGLQVLGSGVARGKTVVQVR